MLTNLQRFFLLTVGLLFCILGCTRDRAHVLMPDHISPPMEVHETVDTKASFEKNLLPILTARCALSGCHVADGPHGLDFRTYESFIAGGEHGPAFIPGNAKESEVVEQIVLGNMPLGGPPLSDAEIQLFVNWINQQETPSDIVKHEHDEHDDGEDVDDTDAHDDMDDDHDDDMDDAHDMDAHDDMDGDHDDMEDEHDDDGMNGDHDDDDNEHDDDNGHDDDDA